MDMGMMGQALAVGGGLAAAVIWICKSMFLPLKEMLERINKTLEKLNDKLDVETQERHELEVWVQQVDDQGKSNTHRIDQLEGKMMP